MGPPSSLFLKPLTSVERLRDAATVSDPRLHPNGWNPALPTSALVHVQLAPLWSRVDRQTGLEMGHVLGSLEVPMSTSTIIWIIVIVIVVLLALALLASIAGKKRKERDRLRAEELRTEATGKARSVQDSQLQAQEAEADAQRKRAEAERAAAQAADARQGSEVARAEHEDKIRTADRVDPDVDHKADDYEPRPLGEPGHDDQPPVDPDHDTRAADDPRRTDHPSSSDPSDPLAPREPPADGTHRA